MIKSKKAGMSISVVLLVIGTLVLCITALVFFAHRQNLAQNKFSDLEVIDGFYSDRIAFDFFIYQIAIEVVAENSRIDANGFLSKFQVKFIAKINSPGIPSSFSGQEIKNQIENNLKYKIEIKDRTINYIRARDLVFILKDFEFARDYQNSDGGITKISYTDDISINIVLA